MIPKYEDLKKLNKNEEHTFEVLSLWGYTYLRIKYNEDLNGMIALDFMQDGYLHGLHLPIYPNKIELNNFYCLNKKNYGYILKTIKKIKDALSNSIKELEKELEEYDEL